jgi:hypothetical protein
MPANINNAWMHTVWALSSRSVIQGSFPDVNEMGAIREEQYSSLITEGYEGREVFVSIIDRPSARTATISWRDPTGCCYGDQVWRAGVSRGQGICAMTGQTILRGDAVFKPCARHPLPMNIGAMILAAVVHDTAESF